MLTNLKLQRRKIKKKSPVTRRESLGAIKTPKDSQIMPHPQCFHTDNKLCLSLTKKTTSFYLCEWCQQQQKVSRPCRPTSDRPRGASAWDSHQPETWPSANDICNTTQFIIPNWPGIMLTSFISVHFDSVNKIWTDRLRTFSLFQKVACAYDI